jgi:hypothetical protein
MDIAITLTPEGLAALQNIRDYPNALWGAMRTGLNRGLELVLSRVQATRFTGEGPFPVSEHRLGHVTTRLRTSLRVIPATVDAEGVEGAIGSNVKYFAVHEYGFNGAVQVRAHSRLRVVNDKGRPVRAGAAKPTRTRVFTGYEGTVKAHSRRMNVPARAPLRTGIQEGAPLIANALSAELVLTWNKNKTRLGFNTGK